MVEISDEVYINLYESAEMYKTLIETSPDAVTATDLKGNITLVSKQTLELHGYRNEKELIGKSAFELIAPEDHERAMVNLQKTLTEGSIRNIEYTLLKRDGTRFIGELNASLIKNGSGNPKAFIASTRDISWRKRIEETLRESEEKYRNLFEQSPIGVGLASPDGRIIAANKAMETITGYSLEELKKINLIDTYENPEDRKVLVEALRQNGSVINFPVRLRRKVGTAYDALLNISIIHIADKDLFQTICIDVTDHKRLEEAMRESEELYRTLAESAQEFIFILDAERNIQYINGFAASYVRQAPEKLIGRKLDEFIPSSVLERAKWDLKKVFDEGQVFVAETRLNLFGTEMWLETRLVPLKKGEGRVRSVLGISRDMTKYKLIEDELMRKISELKEFNDQAVGKELKLIEMEKELNRLRQQISQEKDKVI
ncbi:hypothetical protein AMJ44_03645 [candidate division WOR-1 bacterium DG_54_3]|uniref:Histidine kinase n=1 Tax=candidate division WOR-1 bacterium DG_54_3 TaxID=1703775 RepID=A0A0S7Y407_UNCSA|nr:MAG: hypothetical protein AMJ44_03645 [candidate division WOR-1 bacterium DG_54_3]